MADHFQRILYKNPRVKQIPGIGSMSGPALKLIEFVKNTRGKGEQLWRKSPLGHLGKGNSSSIFKNYVYAIDLDKYASIYIYMYIYMCISMLDVSWKHTFSFLEDKTVCRNWSKNATCSEVSNCKSPRSEVPTPRAITMTRYTCRSSVSSAQYRLRKSGNFAGPKEVWWSGVKSAERSSWKRQGVERTWWDV